MKKTHNKHRVISKKLSLIILITITLTTSVIYLVNNKDSLITDRPFENPLPADTSDYVNLSPPTEQDNIDVNNTKTELEKVNEQNETKVEPTNNATIVITYAGQDSGYIEVSSYVQNVFEDGGECSLKLTKNNEVYSTKSSGITDARYTLCPTFSISETELSAGDWTGVVSYKSDNYSGNSETIEIVVVR